MPHVLMGNPDPIGPGAVPGCVTEVTIPDSKSVDHAFSDVTSDDGGPNTGVWAAHSRAAAPSWVESDNEELRARLAAHYGCRIGRPQPATKEQ